MSIHDVKRMTAEELAERKGLEAKLLQAQRMESIGHMAGAVAHDVNNILHVIVGFGSLSLAKMKEDDPLRYNLNQIIAAAGRASNLTRTLLSSKTPPVVTEPVDIRKSLNNVRSFLDMVVGEDVGLKLDCTGAPLEVMADSGKLEQVVINLATNARHAMPDGGTLSIVTQSVQVDEECSKIRGFTGPGSYALITVSDDGIGMDHETVCRIFEPFFTTKAPRNGTGLGLSIVYRIIREHKGFIEVSSAPGEGTTFGIYLPLIKAKRRKGPADPDQPTATPQHCKRDEAAGCSKVISIYQRVLGDPHKRASNAK